MILLYYYVKDISCGLYKDYHYGKLVFIVAVLLYVVSPLDVIPDFLTGIGLLDDAALITYALHLADKELQRYFQWRRQRTLKKK